MTIHLTFDTIIRGLQVTQAIPPRKVDPDAYDALSAAIQDADITAGNNDDGRPDEGAWDKVVECWMACEGNTP